MMEAIVSSCQGGENEIAADKIELPKLTKLDLYTLLSFTTFCKATNAIELPQLNNLNLWEIPRMKNLCCPTSESNYDTIIPSLFYNKKGGLTQLDWLHNLKSIHVEACNEMESVFSLSMARGLVQLQTLEIRRCDMIEAIILSEGGEHEIAATSTANKIEFPKLEKLYLHKLPSFTAFCEAMNVIELPRLKDLNLSGIPKFKSLCNPTSVSNYDTVIQPLFNKKVKFSSIEKMFFSRMDNLIEIWPGELGAKLREMSIYKCHGLLNIFQANSVKFMQDLELLEVKECRSVKVAFDLGGLIVRELIVREGHPAVALFSLTNVKLIHLPKLSHVWMNNSARIQGFNQLRSLRVKGCGKLRNLFSSSLAKLFVKLQELDITECLVMEAVIAKEQRGYTFEGSFLKNLQVINCPKMEALPSLFQHTQELQRSNDGFHEDVQKTDKAPRKIMRLMCVQCCGKLSTVTTSSSMQKFHNLAQLKVWWCNSVDVIFDLEGIWAEEGTITQLSELDFKYLPKLMHIWKTNSTQQTQCFRNLRSLKVKRCDSVRYIFTLSMAKVLLNLECLRVGHCEKVEKIVMRDEEEEEEDDEVIMNMCSTVFPKLRTIKLKDLPSFVCFGPGENDRALLNIYVAMPQPLIQVPLLDPVQLNIVPCLLFEITAPIMVIKKAHEKVSKLEKKVLIGGRV
ncbi:unnamed protein product [Camellia sinensis]